VGPNDLPYPVLVTDKRVYLFAEKVVVPRANFAYKHWVSDADWELATGEYYLPDDNLTKPSAAMPCHAVPI
jgi:hypothetical protein